MNLSIGNFKFLSQNNLLKIICPKSLPHSIYGLCSVIRCHNKNTTHKNTQSGKVPKQLSGSEGKSDITILHLNNKRDCE